jgi:hypothetical protein
MSPCANRTVVAAREGNPVDLVDAEVPDSPMFFADPKITLVAPAQAVGHHDHFSFWERLVDPTVEERSDLDGDPELLANFPRKAAFQGLPGLELPARKFPLSAPILQQNHLAALIENFMIHNMGWSNLSWRCHFSGAGSRLPEGRTGTLGPGSSATLIETACSRRGSQSCGEQFE